MLIAQLRGRGVALGLGPHGDDEAGEPQPQELAARLEAQADVCPGDDSCLAGQVCLDGLGAVEELPVEETEEAGLPAGVFLKVHGHDDDVFWGCLEFRVSSCP